MKLSILAKKLIILGATLMMAVPLVTTGSIQKVHAATDVMEFSGMQRVLYVVSPYSKPYGVRLLDEHGNYMKQIVYGGDAYKVFAVGSINGKAMYRIGNQQQWIPAHFSNLTGNSPWTNGQTASGNITIKYVPNYSIAVWNSPTYGRSTTGRLLKHGTQWGIYQTASGNDGYIWYNLNDGAGEWISSQYTNKPQKF